MKSLTILFALSLTGFLATAQTREKAFHLLDSVFNTGSFSFEITEFDFPPDIREILLKFNNAVAANKEWFTAYSSHALAGQPLPYDEKFGITREEYGRIKNMDRIHPALKVVDTQKVTILRQEDRITFQGEGDGRILNYLEIYLGKKELIFAGDTIPFTPGANPTTATAYSMFNIYTWRLQKNDLHKSLQADQLTARMVEVELGSHQPGNKLLLRIQYQDLENGVSHANLDLSGYINAAVR